MEIKNNKSNIKRDKNVKSVGEKNYRLEKSEYKKKFYSENTLEDDYSVDVEKMQRILSRFKPSTEPKCPIYKECGGCQL